MLFTALGLIGAATPSSRDALDTERDEGVASPARRPGLTDDPLA
jgi:hypothetical protein